MQRFLRHYQIYEERLPLMKIRKKNEISSSQLLIVRDMQNLPLDICFVDVKNDEIS